jgi:hypothetical protein
MEPIASEGGDTAYNYILFRNSLGEDAMALHALPLPRKDKTLTLRGVMDQPAKPYIRLRGLKIVNEACLFEGSGEDYLQKLVCALDAMKFLNEQNINYAPESENYDSPNSITSALVKAMGLEIPQDITQFWIDGYDRQLLPQEWRSAYAQ